MALDTILYVSDGAPGSDSISAALKAHGYEVVTTDSSTQAAALLFIMRFVAGIVFDHQVGKHSTFDVVRSLRSLRPHVPIVLLCRNQVDHPPPCVDACVSTEQPLEELASEVERLLTPASFAVHSAPC
jgi:CheY-like chemotaxis protein